MRLEKSRTERKESMSRIFKNMLPYWKAVIIIIALLFVFEDKLGKDVEG